MHRRPANRPLVFVGLMGIGIGTVGMLFYLLSPAAERNTPVASCVIAGIGVTTTLVGWFYDPSD